MEETETQGYKTLSPEAYKVWNSRLPDWPSLSMKVGRNLFPRLTLRAKLLGHSLTTEELLEVADIDRSAPSQLMESVIRQNDVEAGTIDKSESVVFTPIRVALIDDKTGELQKHDNGSVKYVGNFRRFLPPVEKGQERKWVILGAGGDPFNPRSDIFRLRMLGSEDGKPLAAQTYADCQAGIERKQAAFEKGLEKKQADKGLASKLFGNRGRGGRKPQDMSTQDRLKAMGHPASHVQEPDAE